MYLSGELDADLDETRCDRHCKEIQDATLECRQLARSERWQQDWENRWPPGFYDRRFMRPHYHWAHPFWQDFPLSIELEQDLFCMHSRGFRRHGMSPRAIG